MSEFVDSKMAWNDQVTEKQLKWIRILEAEYGENTIKTVERKMDREIEVEK